MNWLFSMISKLRMEGNNFNREALQKHFKDDVLDEQQFELLLEVFLQFNEILLNNGDIVVKMPESLNENQMVVSLLINLIIFFTFYFSQKI